MKKLTMNRLAFSGIRANKKDYLLLGISAFLAIFAADFGTREAFLCPE